MYRQGDVLLVPLNVMPTNLKRVARKGGRIILALGEATGHAHAVADADAELLDAGFDRILRIGEEGATLSHEEHAPIRLPAGAYRVVLQREYRDGGSSPVGD
jgi:hypothetical protein